MQENIKSFESERVAKITQIEQEYFKVRNNLEQKDIIWSKLNNIIREISKKQKEENPSLLIDVNTGRLDINQYHQVYEKEKCYSKEVKEGIEETIREYKEKWYQDIIDNKIHISEYAENILKGEKAEFFILEILYKFLSQDFIIVRSSEYDDIDNSVDTIVLDKHNGNIICAFDEASTFSPYFEDKKRKILLKNIKGGTRLKYGLKLEYLNNRANIKGSPVNNIPIFYLAIDIRDMEKELNQKDQYGINEIYDIDRLTFRYLIHILNEQVKQMRDLNLSNLPEMKISDDIYHKASQFIEKIVKVYPNILYQDSVVNYKKGILKPEFYTSKHRINPQDIDKFRETQNK